MTTGDVLDQPALSVILPTDTAERIDVVVRALRHQTLASRLEVVLVTTTPERLADMAAQETAFAAVRVVGVDTLSPMGIPRVAGIRAARAPFIFVGETHSFLHPDAARLLVAAAKGEWAAVVPGFENANPGSALSWASFLSTYSTWTALAPEGEIPEAPIYDCLYRRDALLAMGDALAPMLSFGDDLKRALHARGLRVLFHPTARLKHVNLESFGAWVHEHFLIGVMIGTRRAQQWSWARRFVYVAGAALIPPVLFWRGWPNARLLARSHRLPAGTWPLVGLIYMLKAAGEVLGYVGAGGTPGQEAALNLYELRRFEYVSPSTRRSYFASE